ncbi:MAG: HlyC/CorC family transporter [Phycisphaerae bacterium]|nr:HlyC/CorC family transporter [Phycisphaerae bacterium]
MGSQLQLALLVVLLVCSAMVSGSETALFALSRQNLRAFERSSNRFKRSAAMLMRRPRTVLITVLIANTTVNICFFAVSVIFFRHLSRVHPLAAVVGSLLAPFVLILFSEVLPKAAALAHSQNLAPYTAPLIKGLAIALTPLRIALEHLVVSPLTRMIIPGRAEKPHVTTAELKTLVEMSARQGVINVRENEILQQIVAFPETSVRSVMVPRMNIAAVPITADREAVRRRIRESGKKRIPVFGRDMDDILGLIHAVDLHLNHKCPLCELLKPAHFVPEQANLLQLVREFRRSGTQLAIVVDEYGGTAGLVSLEDVMEQIVGDIADADEETPQPTVETIDENTYRLSGDISVSSLADYFGVRPGAERVETLGGFMLSRIGRLPKPGDFVRVSNLKLTVERVAARRVEYVLAELADPDAAPDDGEIQP